MKRFDIIDPENSKSLISAIKKIEYGILWTQDHYMRQKCSIKKAC